MFISYSYIDLKTSVVEYPTLQNVSFISSFEKRSLCSIVLVKKLTNFIVGMIPPILKRHFNRPNYFTWLDPFEFNKWKWCKPQKCILGIKMHHFIWLNTLSTLTMTNKYDRRSFFVFWNKVVSHVWFIRKSFLMISNDWKRFSNRC